MTVPEVEIDRVPRPGGRLQIADVVIHEEVSEDARKRIYKRSNGC